MITIYPFEELGEANFQWLKARYHFSFAYYYNPKRRGFGKLRVVNDDVIKPKSGFGEHSHKDMEIITYIRSGAITHKDNKGNKGKITAGSVQVMSAGSGIKHSEYNLENEDTVVYQIWIEPHTKNLEPSWSTIEFPSKYCSDDKLPLLVSGKKVEENILHINQSASIYGGKVYEGKAINHKIENQVYILLSEGEVELEGYIMKKGDGCEVTNLKEITIKAITKSEIVIIDIIA